MNRHKPRCRFALLAVDAGAVAACSDPNGAAQPMHTSEVAECSLVMPATSTALDVQRTVAAVLAGDRDPCGGAVDLTGTYRELLRINEDGADILLFFRITRYHGPGHRPQVP